MVMLTILFLWSACVLGHVSTAHVSCQHGWKAHQSICFQYFSAPMNWSEALDNCLKLGGNLASIHSLAEERFLLSMIRSHTGSDLGITWIGRHDVGLFSEMEFQWTDMSTSDFRPEVRRESMMSVYGLTLEEPAGGSPQWFPEASHRHHPSLCQNRPEHSSTRDHTSLLHCLIGII
ncbi:galactose-specific lectin nattectin-like [Esox lucius]|uniref:galactose-specific lectin nattectin-like n=1 Tax=Esox lucius TaxID=8010 RepID=UPI0010BD1CBB|nr:galactose-specific lectin nattectin-like [Esox lucius]